MFSHDSKVLLERLGGRKRSFGSAKRVNKNNFAL